METGPSMRIMRTMASEWPNRVAIANAQAMGPKRGWVALRSMTQALVQYRKKRVRSRITAPK